MSFLHAELWANESWGQVRVAVRSPNSHERIGFDVVSHLEASNGRPCHQLLPTVYQVLYMSGISTIHQIVVTAYCTLVCRQCSVTVL